jgi:hypothetical protein
MSSPPVVALRVTPEMKALLCALADREQITESALVRQLLEAMFRRSAMEALLRANQIALKQGPTKRRASLSAALPSSASKGSW